MNSMSSERLSDRILNSNNRIHTAKLSGALQPDELSEIIISVSSVYANQCQMGQHSDEDEIESYLANIPNTSEGYYNYKHVGLDKSYNASVETITMAQLERENRFSVAKVMKP